MKSINKIESNVNTFLAHYAKEEYNEEYEDLLDQSHDFFKGNGIKTMGLNKTILIKEVYDSIAVGKIIKNANTCLKLFPGDILKMEK